MFAQKAPVLSAGTVLMARLLKRIAQRHRLINARHAVNKCSPRGNQCSSMRNNDWTSPPTELNVWQSISGVEVHSLLISMC
jgi:hypothetical protein